MDVLPRAAGALAMSGRAVVVKLQGDADDVVAFRLQQGGHDRGIDAPRHGNDHARVLRPSLGVQAVQHHSYYRERRHPRNARARAGIGWFRPGRRFVARLVQALPPPGGFWPGSLFRQRIELLAFSLQCPTCLLQLFPSTHERHVGRVRRVALPGSKPGLVHGQIVNFRLGQSERPGRPKSQPWGGKSRPGDERGIFPN